MTGSGPVEKGAVEAGNYECLNLIFNAIDDQHHTDIIVTSLPLWEVEKTGRCWGICDIKNYPVMKVQYAVCNWRSCIP